MTHEARRAIKARISRSKAKRNNETTYGKAGTAD